MQENRHSFDTNRCTIHHST